MHLSTHLADLFFLPLEALFVRSVALGFLSAAASRTSSGSVDGMRNQVIPLGRCFGMGIKASGLSQYVRNLAFCGALEVVLGLGIWQLSTGAAWFMGWKWFRWSSIKHDESGSEKRRHT